MDPRHKKLGKAIGSGCMLAIKETCIVSYIYMSYKQWYYVGQPIVNDHEFDSYEEMLKQKDPDNPVLTVVGLLVPRCSCCNKPASKGVYSV